MSTNVYLVSWQRGFSHPIKSAYVYAENKVDAQIKAEILFSIPNNFDIAVSQLEVH